MMAGELRQRCASGSSIATFAESGSIRLRIYPQPSKETIRLPNFGGGKDILERHAQASSMPYKSAPGPILKWNSCTYPTSQGKISLKPTIASNKQARCGAGKFGHGFFHN